MAADSWLRSLRVELGNAVAMGSGVTQILQSFQDRVDVDLVRSQKIRTGGITMALVSDVIGEGYKDIEPCQDLVEEIELLDTLWHHCPRIERTASSSLIIGLVSRESPHTRSKFAANMSLVLDSETRFRLFIALRNTSSPGSGKE